MFKVYTDAAETADQADRSSGNEPSSTDKRQLLSACARRVVGARNDPPHPQFPPHPL
jgi:hypothetical protein